MWQMKVCPFAFQGEISATVIQKVAYFFFFASQEPQAYFTTVKPV